MGTDSRPGMTSTPFFQPAPDHFPPPVPYWKTSGATPPPAGPAAKSDLLARAADIRHPGLEDPAHSLRFGTSERANRITLVARQVHHLQLTRPCVLVPLGVVTAVLYYTTGVRPTWTAATPPVGAGSRGDDAPLKSVGPGVCLLSAKGDWYIYASQASGSIECAVVPAEDGSQVARYLAEAGVHGVGATVGQFTAASTVVAANRDRKALIVQNTGGGGTMIRVGLGYTPTYGLPPVGVGIALSSQGTLTLADSTLWRGSVEVVGSGVTPYEIVELV